MTSDVEVLNLIPAASHLAANRPSECWRLLPELANLIRSGQSEGWSYIDVALFFYRTTREATAIVIVSCLKKARHFKNNSARDWKNHLRGEQKYLFRGQKPLLPFYARLSMKRYFPGLI